MFINKYDFDLIFSKLMNELLNKSKYNLLINKWILLINKKKKYNLYNLANEFYYKFKLNNKKALNYVMDEINDNDNIDTNKLLIYLIRIWNYYDNTYAFKIGYTDNLSKRLIDINYRYDCNWRIIIIMCANINDKKIEKQIHDKISINHNKLIIGNLINNKPKELYNTDLSLYNSFAEIIENKKIKYFESNDYLYDNSSNDEKIYDEKMYNIKLLQDEDNYIYLDQNINENKYWLNKQKYLLI